MDGSLTDGKVRLKLETWHCTKEHGVDGRDELQSSG